MGLPEIFNTAQADSFEQTLMMTTFELASWLVAFIAVMTVVVTVIGIIHLIRSESRTSSAISERLRVGHVFRRQVAIGKSRIQGLRLSHPTSFNR